MESYEIRYLKAQIWGVAALLIYIIGFSVVALGEDVLSKILGAVWIAFALLLGCFTVYQEWQVRRGDGESKDGGLGR